MTGYPVRSFVRHMAERVSFTGLATRFSDPHLVIECPASYSRSSTSRIEAIYMRSAWDDGFDAGFCSKDMPRRLSVVSWRLSVHARGPGPFPCDRDWSDESSHQEPAPQLQCPFQPILCTSHQPKKRCNVNAIYRTPNAVSHQFATLPETP